MIVLLGGLLAYGLGATELLPVPRPELVAAGTTLIGTVLLATGACDLFVKKTKEIEIEERDERNVALSNAAMAAGFKVMSMAVALCIAALLFTGCVGCAPRPCPDRGLFSRPGSLYYHSCEAGEDDVTRSTLLHILRKRAQ